MGVLAESVLVYDGEIYTVQEVVMAGSEVRLVCLSNDGRLITPSLDDIDNLSSLYRLFISRVKAGEWMEKHGTEEEEDC
jgi:hypothetical protein